MACTDTFSLNNSKMFEQIRKGLPTNQNQTQNIMETSDDLLFVWDTMECCLLVVNWRAVKLKGSENIKYQVSEQFYFKYLSNPSVIAIL